MPSLSAFEFPDFRRFVTARFLALASHQMLLVAVSQAVFELTHSPLHLGYIGLALFFPKIGLSLLAGHAADRFDRRGIILACRVVQFLAVVGLIVSFLVAPHVLPIFYGLLVLLGTANAFDGPASQSIVTQLVPKEKFANAVAWNSSVMQIAFIAGPALGGWFYALSGQVIFVLSIVALLRFGSVWFVARMHPRTDHIEPSELSWSNLMAGIRYVFRARVILGAISLDLFAVLFGGVVALLPIYANDILKVGPSGLGFLRAAPSVGAALMAIALAYRTPLERPGLSMLWCVALFGLATLLFAVSRHFIFSLVCLVALGAADMVSVVIRGILVQVETPPAMRGRVSAVNFIFIGASNELGEFESGLTASWFGVVPAAVIGGLGTLAVVSLWAMKFPELRQYRGSPGAGSPESGSPDPG